MRIAFMLPYLLLGFIAQSQKVLKGQVKDAVSNRPIAAASVFLNNTSVGTPTDSNGMFEFRLPAGKYELVASYVGYETAVQTISAYDSLEYLTIKLQPHIKELQAVVVEAFEKDGWKKWGQFFTDQFIGTSAIASRCRLKNPEVLRFRHSKKNNELTVVALEPLIIENPSLGYTLRFQLESFIYQFDTRYQFYQGYPFFIPMAGNQSRQNRWAARRQQVYYGSMLHFMRSLYRNSLSAEGFELQRLKRLPNEEKERVKNFVKGNFGKEKLSGVGTTVRIEKLYDDSSDYYEKILRQPSYLDIVDSSVLTGDSIAYAVDSHTIGVSFDHYLLIRYTKKPTPSEFQRMYPNEPTAMLSQITLLNNRPIEVQPNGMYFDPKELMQLGYWSWSEKVGTLLPLDYTPRAEGRDR